MTLEEMLDELSRYGTTDLFQSETTKTWRAICTLAVKVEGGQFKVASDFGHATPHSAVAQCLDRVRSMLQDVHKLAPTIPHKKPALVHGVSDT